MKIPASGMDRDTVFATLNEYRAHDMPWRNGRVFGYVFHLSEEVEAVVKQAYSMFLSENALDPTVFPSAARLENEVVSMAAAHLAGDQEVVGNFTSGGTESIILAVKTARDRARHLRPDIDRPNLVLPVTGHAAFHKAGYYLGVEVRTTPVDPKTFKADVEAMRAAIDDNTILLVGSAVSYAHSVVDDITAIAALAAEKDILCHVDACMGGFMLPYFRRLGCDIPPFDFSVPGVTSMSMDLHKYGFAAKGASVILHRNADIRRFQIYSCADWTGYTIVNATVQSSKSVGPMAAAWAVLNFVGDQGYLDVARSLLEATNRLIEGVGQIDGLEVLATPEMNLIAFTSDTVNIFHIIDEMKARNWYIQPQLRYRDAQASIHLSVNPNNVPLVEEFLTDLAASTESARSLPESPLVAQLKGALDAMGGDAELPRERVAQLMAMAGIRDGALPERMADINSLMNALPPKLQETLVVEFINQMFQQPTAS